MDNYSQEESTIDMHATVHGDVQGVGFRVTTLRYAQRLGLVGYVRNLDNGDVEIQAQGSRENIEKLLSLLKQKFGDSITDISLIIVPYNDALNEFQIII